ncbi:XTP/dITP diphosphohydrolase [Sinobacterium caligoides]|uniref:dITP/XTP pyrophosphatase n=1 Tax=Sinobacterium caligoides TaxID=933926 RepID=A0A3N2DGL9_9GAMM|nr:RdgB/HAM1 family non-canonical purine NTP pyrophosphatase [Sinobacterium caligoides]ROR98935.1 XTP/dITP diphosphohydrolase [Sinobacterium caligoides]
MANKIVLASGNPGKLNEFNELLTDLDVEIVAQTDFDFAEAIEDGLSFVENAIIKARHACQHTGLAAIADDSGLEVDALQGAPGIYSARYSDDVTGGQATDQSNNSKLLTALAGLLDDQRNARFHCVLVYMRHATDPTPLICQASWSGRIAQQAQGEQGFGYDPLFWLDSHNCSSAELPRTIKNQISHRAQALRLLLPALQRRL